MTAKSDLQAYCREHGITNEVGGSDLVPYMMIDGEPSYITIEMLADGLVNGAHIVGLLKTMREDDAPEGTLSQSDLRHIDPAVVAEIDAELGRANMHQAMHSLHEAHSVILEELDEFWEHVRAARISTTVGSNPEVRAELIQVAAMAVRTIQDLHL